MPPVTIAKRCKIAPDGIHVNEYRCDDVIDVPEQLAAALIRDGLAVHYQGDWSQAQLEYQRYGRNTWSHQPHYWSQEDWHAFLHTDDPHTKQRLSEKAASSRAEHVASPY